MIIGNVLLEMFECRLQDLLKTSMYAKHIIVYLLFFMFLVMNDDDITNKNIFQVLFITFIPYIWFLFTTRMNVRLALFVILLLFVVYILNLYIEKYRISYNKDLNFHLSLR